MKSNINLVIIVGIVSVAVGIISRITLIPVGPMRIEAQAFLQFSNTCFLLAIALGLLELVKTK